MRPSIKWQGRLTPEMRAQLPREIDHYLGIAVNGREAYQQEALLAYVRTLDKARHAVGGLMQPLPFAGLAACACCKRETGWNRDWRN